MVNEMTKIAIDTAGGDFGPENTVHGTCQALAENPDLSCLFYGDAKRILEAIPNTIDKSRIEIIASSETITDEENPLAAIRRKTDSSIVKGLKAVKEKHADAFVSAGNSGAI